MLVYGFYKSSEWVVEQSKKATQSLLIRQEKAAYMKVRIVVDKREVNKFLRRL